METAMMAEPLAALDDLPLPRRVAVATLFTQVLSTERALAALYGGFAERTTIPYLRAALEELAAAKRSRVADLEALAPTFALEGGVVEPVPDPPSRLPAARTELFAHAFEAERMLEAAYREIVALLDDPRRCPEFVELRDDSARHRGLLRDLYLRYS